MPRTPPSSCPTPTSSSRSRSACSGSLSFNGQRCTALKMLLVHQSIAEPFLHRFCEELARLKVGMPWEQGVSDHAAAGAWARSPTWPSWSPTPWPRAHASSTRAAARSAGTLYYPAVVYPVAEGMKLYREEQFGPVVPVMPFERSRDGAGIRDHLRARPAGQHLQRRPGPDRERWSIRWSTRSAGSTSIASASVVRMCSRSPAARIRPRARCR